MNRPGRREAAIDPQEGPLQKFAHELRTLRHQAGAPSYQDLAKQTRQIGQPFSASTLRNAASGTLLPTAAVTAAFVRACLRYATQHKGQLPQDDILSWDAENVVARWVERRDELARILHRPTVVRGTEPDGRETASHDRPTITTGTATPPTVGMPMPEPALSAPPRGANSLRTAAVGMALVGVVIGIVVVLVWTTLLNPDRTDTGASATTPTGPVPQTSLPGELTSGKCRGAYELGAVAVNPCIKPTADGLEIVVHVTALKPAPAIAIHLWLHDATTRTRMTDTLHHCQAQFTTAGQTFSCGPVTIRPTPGHRYAAASSAQPGTQTWPDRWKDPNATGLTSPVVPWPSSPETPTSSSAVAPMTETRVQARHRLD